MKSGGRLIMHDNLDQAAGLRNINKIKPIRVLAIISGKGGIGKTNIAVNLGVALSQLGKNVALFDADIGLANVDTLLGIEPEFNISHVLKGQKALNDIIEVGPSNLKVIPASSGVQYIPELNNSEHALIIKAFDECRDDLDVLIVDTATGISNSVVSFIKACQEVVVVISDEPTALVDAYAFIKLLNCEHELFKFHVIANMLESVDDGQILFKKLSKMTHQYLDVALNYLGAVPFDDYLRKAVKQQAAVVDIYPQSKSAQAFRRIGQKISELPDCSFTAAGHVEFFVERMLEYEIQESVA